MKTYFTIREIREANAAIGHHWFEPATMRFFKSRVSGPVIANMFVSSEQPPHGSRRYMIRRINENGSIDTVQTGTRDSFDSKQQALSAIRKLAKEGSTA